MLSVTIGQCAARRMRQGQRHDVVADGICVVLGLVQPGVGQDRGELFPTVAGGDVSRALEPG
jgi:hypothetical protein